MVSFRYRNAHSPLRRLIRRSRSLLGAAGGKSHAVHIVGIGNGRYKRVRFDHASEAQRVERHLEAVRSLQRFPVPVFRHDAELWVEYVVGEPLTQARDDGAAHVIDFYAGLYGLEPRRCEPAPSGTHQRLLTDLDFLQATGVLPGALVEALRESASRLRPPAMWMGFDYLDPVRKNFVMADGGLVAVDVEALHAEQPLGAGLAKALLRWLPGQPDELVQQLAERGAPDLCRQFPYVDLAFLCSYTKQKLFQGKRRHLRPERFRQWLQQWAPERA